MLRKHLPKLIGIALLILTLPDLSEFPSLALRTAVFWCCA